MALKFRVPKLEDVPEALRSMYRQSGNEFVLDAEGAEDLSRLSEFRDNNTKLGQKAKELEDRLKAFDGLDPSAVASLREAAEKAKVEEEKELIRKGKWDELVARRTAAADLEHKRKLDEVNGTLGKKDETIKALRGQLQSLMVDSEVQRAIEAAGLKPRTGATADIFRRARDTWRVGDDGQLRAFVPGKDEPLYSKQKAGDALSMKEYVTGFLAAEAGHLFEGASGGGAGGSKSPAGAGGGSPTILRNPDARTFGQHAAEIAKGTVKVVYE